MGLLTRAREEGRSSRLLRNFLVQPLHCAMYRRGNVCGAESEYCLELVELEMEDGPVPVGS